MSTTADELKEEVFQAFKEAERSAQVAFHAYRADAPKDAHGNILDGAGLVSTRFIGDRKMQNVLKALKLAIPTTRKGVLLRAFSVPEQSITAQEKAAQAGVDVLNARLSGYGEFFVESRLD